MRKRHNTHGNNQYEIIAKNNHNKLLQYEYCKVKITLSKYTFNLGDAPSLINEETCMYKIWLKHSTVIQSPYVCFFLIGAFLGPDDPISLLRVGSTATSVCVSYIWINKITEILLIIKKHGNHLNEIQLLL